MISRARRRASGAEGRTLTKGSKCAAGAVVIAAGLAVFVALGNTALAGIGLAVMALAGIALAGIALSGIALSGIALDETALDDATLNEPTLACPPSWTGIPTGFGVCPGRSNRAGLKRTGLNWAE